MDTSANTGKKPTTVLIVDDEESVRKMVSYILEMQGYSVLTASYGDQALNVIKEHEGDIHLLLTDVRMEPFMSGCKLAQLARPLVPGLKVLYMSGFPVSDVVQKEVDQHSAGFIPKPFTPTVLIDRIKASLEARHEAVGVARALG